MKRIEVEIRSFLSQEHYERLLIFFQKHARYVNEDEQETHYFKSDRDIRIQRNNYFSKIWLKSGALHDESREELEIQCNKDDFEKLSNLFSALGYEIETKWFRNRTTFLWDGITVSLDITRGYGIIIELEKIVSEEDQEATLDFLREKMKELGVQLTSREIFEERYNYYKTHWRTLV